MPTDTNGILVVCCFAGLFIELIIMWVLFVWLPTRKRRNSRRTD